MYGNVEISGLCDLIVNTLGSFLGEDLMRHIRLPPRVLVIGVRPNSVISALSFESLPLSVPA
jgi:hypothetical protein